MFLIPKEWYQVKKIRRKGRGVFATHDIEVGTVIGDYLGKIIKPYSNNEKKSGLYDMQASPKYDIMGDRNKIGIPLINHSCANNCDFFPYDGHVLYFALRKIFKGEELSVDYGIGDQNEKDLPCYLHACHCGSKICTGSMHWPEASFEEWYLLWEALRKRQQGVWYRKIPGKYGGELAPLETYPTFVDADKYKIYEYNIFGSEMKSPVKYNDAILPSIKEMRKRIKTTGRQLLFPKLHLSIYGIQDGMIFAEQK